MVSPANIVIVWPSDKEFVIAPVEKRLHELGHAVTRYKEIADAVAAGERILADADVLLPFPEFPSTRALLTNASRLRAAISPVTGIDGIDLTAANDLKIVVGNVLVPESHESMAEATILMMLSALYDLRGSEYLLRNNLPSRPPVARMAKNRTVGMIGFGHISRAIAARLAGWEMKLQAYAPRLRAPLPENVTRVELDELLRTSDIVLVLASLNAETRKLLNAERLASMKKGAILVNTARGAIVDENAMFRLAKSGHLRTIAVDVFETEPLPADNQLRELPNAILTGHCVGHTIDTIEAQPLFALESIARVLKGEPPLSVKNPDVLPAWRQRWGG
ncbi:MAG TPA: NAD(P)-dependent oxidoreductase [Xanthobacteraceae bacterium]|nr:NAD(P)-dependent oxidoreductase [Xanthobacteraceae bacterium]